MKFNNADVDAQFECLVEQDRQVHKLGLYSGLLSKITLPMAEHLTQEESVLIKRKTGVEKSSANNKQNPLTPNGAKKEEALKAAEKTE